MDIYCSEIGPVKSVNSELISGDLEFKCISIGIFTLEVLVPYTTEQLDAIETSLCHEFFHASQFNYPNIFVNWVDIAFKYIVEGQARFIQSEYMANHSTGGTNLEFIIGSRYHGDANNYLENDLNKSLTELEYSYCIFWRSLFENYNSLNIIKSVLEESNSVGNDPIVDGEIAINQALSSCTGGIINYTSYDDAVKDFAKKIYFNDPDYNKWDPNPPNFYNDVYLKNSETFGGSVITIQESIPVSFGIDFHEIDFTSIGVINIEFDGDPDGVGYDADFSVNTIIYNGSSILSDNFVDIDLAGEGNIELDIANSNQKLVIIVTRLDVDEGTVNDNYEIQIVPNSNLYAFFTASPNPVLQGNSVIFADESIGNIISWEWTFEDGDPSEHSGPTPPTITYGTNVSVGPHIAALTISDGATGDYFELYIDVEENSEPLVANFSSDDQSVAVGDAIYFSDQSTGAPETWEWSFEPSNIIYLNGTSSDTQNPVVEFTSQGNHDVTLTVENANGSDTETKTDYISVSNSTLNANFTPILAEIEKDEYVEFEDTSEGDIISWNWEFEGGTPNYSSNQDPCIVSYYNTGTFNVSLTVNDGFNTDTKNGSVEVCSDEFLIVHMYVEPNPTWPGQWVHFTCDVSEGCGSDDLYYYWYSNNVLLTSTPEPEADWVFGYPGNYQVRVDVYDFVSNITHPSYNVSVIISQPWPITASFYLTGYTIQRGEQFKLYDASYPNNLIDTWKIYWDWDNPAPYTVKYDLWDYITHTYDEVKKYYIRMSIEGYASNNNFVTKYVHVVDCNNGVVEICDFSNLTSGWNLPIVATELIIGGSCPPGIIPEIPPEVKIKFYAQEGIRFLDGFHVVADEVSDFSAIPLCPVNNTGENTNNSLVAYEINTNGNDETHQNFESLNISSNFINKSYDYFVYPNPTNDKFVIQTIKPLFIPMEICIYDMMGNIVKNTSGSSNKITVDLSDFERGVYFVKFNYNERVYNEKVILH